jgi:hypothetical protein
MIRIDVADPAARYPLGEAVTGEVHWLPGKSTRYKSVKMKLRWHTEGRGDKDGATVDEHSTPGGETQGSAPLIGPFSLDLPKDGPMSYNGTLIRIIWTLHAEADEPWTLGDEKTEAVIEVGPALPGP